MADINFITSNPAVDEFNRANKVADDAANTQLEQQGKTLTNQTAALKLKTDTAEAPLRLNQLTAETSLTQANAQEAQARAPYAGPMAAAQLKEVQMQALATAQSMSTNQIKESLDVLDREHAALDANNPELADQIAARYGHPIPDKVKQDARFRAGLAAINEQAKSIPNLRQRFAWQMAQSHYWEEHYQDSPQASPQMAPLQQAPGAPELPESTNSKFGVIGENGTGEKVYGFADPSTMTVRPIAPQGATPGQPDATQLHGEDYLKTLDPTQGNQVEALAEGRMAFPSGFALRSPYWQHMLQSVSQYDPTFDAVNYNARSKTRADFTSGKSAQNITSLNTVIGHLGSLLDAAKPLNNSGFVPLNSALNTIETMSGDPRYNNFDLARNAVADELGKVFRSTGMSDTEIAQWKGTLNSSMSYAQVKGAVATALHLLDSRMQAVGEQYTRGMGTTSSPVKLLSPASQRALQKIQQEVGSQIDLPTEAAAAGTSPAAAPPPGTPPNARQAADGNWYLPDPARPGKYLQVVP